MPVVLGDSQSTLPQAQAAGLAEDPSETKHGACLLHRFSDCLQNIPVESANSHSMLPQAQAAGVGGGPFVILRMEQSCCICSLTACKTCLWCWETRNPRCRTHRLQSWQKIRRTPSMQESCGTGSCSSSSACQLPHGQSWQKLGLVLAQVAGTQSTLPHCSCGRLRVGRNPDTACVASTGCRKHRTKLAEDPSDTGACRNLAALVLAQVAVHARGVGRLAIHAAASTGCRVGRRSVGHRACRNLATLVLAQVAVHAGGISRLAIHAAARAGCRVGSRSV